MHFCRALLVDLSPSRKSAASSARYHHASRLIHVTVSIFMRGLVQCPKDGSPLVSRRPARSRTFKAFSLSPLYAPLRLSTKEATGHPGFHTEGTRSLVRGRGRRGGSPEMSPVAFGTLCGQLLRCSRRIAPALADVEASPCRQSDSESLSVSLQACAAASHCANLVRVGVSAQT